MFIEDMRIGMKVVPLKRTTNKGEYKPTHSLVWKEVLKSENPSTHFLIVFDMREDIIPKILCGTSPDFADWFSDTDLVEFNDSSTHGGYPK